MSPPQPFTTPRCLPLALALGDTAYVIAVNAKVAVQVESAERLTEPLTHGADQPAKVEPELGVANKMTSLLISKKAEVEEQVIDGQLIPAD